MTWDSGVSLGLARLSLEPAGSFPKNPLLGPAVRGALLVDLTFAGALTNSEHGLEIDTEPTGFQPADHLLAAIVAQPDHKLEWWLRRGPIQPHDVGEELVRRGLWQHRAGLGHRRYVERQSSLRPALAKSARAALTGAATTPTVAALAAIIQHTGLAVPLAYEPDPQLLAAAGAAEWIVTDVVEYLLTRRRMLEEWAAEAKMSLRMNYIY